MSSLVSIITVSLNSVTTIRDTIDSVAAQNYPEIEHIIVDGDSSDGTKDIIIANQRNQLRWVSEPDDGLYNAMNKGASMARGEFIAFLNADDVYATADVVEKAASILESDGVDACYADLDYVQRENSSITTRRWKSQPYQPGLCLAGWMPPHPTLFLRREVFSRLGGFNESLKYQSDLEFCARAFDVHKISSVYVPKVWVNMRLGGISTGIGFQQIIRRIKGNWESYVALRKLGARRDPISFFVAKFARKLPRFFANTEPR